MLSTEENFSGTKAQILAAAEQQFCRFGFSKVTMEEIAAASGLRKASLYYYFTAKDDLFQAVMEKKRSEFRERVEELAGRDEPAASRIFAYTDARCDYFDGLQNMNIADYKQVSRNASAVREMFRAQAREEMQWLGALLADGARRGEFVLPAVATVAEAFLHIQQGLRLRFMRTYEPATAGAAELGQLRHELMLVTKIFLDGICPRSESKPARSRSRLHTKVHKVHS
jgi:AcrR family transcriptional regulator